ncbi:Hypothetical protein SCF082_LOCUS41488 [Durusdinium trenchii]|uniref:Uncharacterized protein n=1 Tax=Durusdinium trenchii TaxID=1381693 RepID=A0ABP0QJG1_9DINO
MLEPSAIHSYEPPAYRNNPPSPSEGLPPSLPFHCAVLESADSSGGPSPALLHSLREKGCKLILAQVEDLEDLEEGGTARETEEHTDSSPLRRHSLAPRAYRPTSLNREWYDAVFDKVLSITGEEGRGNSPLERFFADEGLPASQAVCFACTDAGSKAFGAVDAGLVLAPSHNKVWRREEEAVHLPGADCALSQSPTARHLAWLHEVFTQKLWCCCMWLAPAPEELRHHAGLPSDGPSAYERATITSVASGTLQALGHPPWASASRWEPWKENEEIYPCMAQLGDELCACPDWTPLEPRFRSRGSLRELVALPKVVLYCHSLDVGLAKVHHLMEAQDMNNLSVRVSSNRLCSLCREGIAATEMSVTLVSCSHQNWPDICIRSSLLCEHLPKNFKFYGKPMVDISKGKAMLQAAYQDENGQILLVRAWHRLCKDDGRGDVELNVNVGNDSSTSSVHVQKASAYWGMPRKDAAEVDIIFSNPRRGTRYTVEKVVSVIANSGRKRKGLAFSDLELRDVLKASGRTQPVLLAAVLVITDAWRDSYMQMHELAGEQGDLSLEEKRRVRRFNAHEDTRRLQPFSQIQERPQSQEIAQKFGRSVKADLEAHLSKLTQEDWLKRLNAIRQPLSEADVTNLTEFRILAQLLEEIGRCEEEELSNGIPSYESLLKQNRALRSELADLHAFFNISVDPPKGPDEALPLQDADRGMVSGKEPIEEHLLDNTATAMQETEWQQEEAAGNQQGSDMQNTKPRQETLKSQETPEQEEEETESGRRGTDVEHSGQEQENQQHTVPLSAAAHLLFHPLGGALKAGLGLWKHSHTSGSTGETQQQEQQDKARKQDETGAERQEPTNSEEAENTGKMQEQEQEEQETGNQHEMDTPELSEHTGIAQEEEQHENDADMKHATGVKHAMPQQEETNQGEAENRGATQEQEQEQQETGNQHDMALKMQYHTTQALHKKRSSMKKMLTSSMQQMSTMQCMNRRKQTKKRQNTVEQRSSRSSKSKRLATSMARKMRCHVMEWTQRRPCQSRVQVISVPPVGSESL